MKKLIFVIVLVVAAKYLFTGSNYPAVGQEASKLKTIDYAKFVRDGWQPLTSLAVEGQNTIIEVYAPSCPACKQFEGMIPKMQKLRPDVYIQQVNITDGFLKGTLSKKIKSDLRQDGICSTPHLVIVDTQGDIVVADNCNTKEAYKYFYTWYNAENKKSFKAKRKE